MGRMTTTTKHSPPTVECVEKPEPEPEPETETEREREREQRGKKADVCTNSCPSPSTKHIASDADVLVGSTVRTPYGEGVVIDYRAKDSVCTVALDSGARLYSSSASFPRSEAASTSKAGLTVKRCGEGVPASAGPRVSTPFGVGKVVGRRDADNVCVIKLDFATLYTSSVPGNDNCDGGSRDDDEQTKEVAVSSPTSVGTITMELNVAYEALEKMRRLNLEMECFERNGMTLTSADHDKCTTCLLLTTRQNHDNHGSSSQSFRFRPLQKLADGGAGIASTTSKSLYRLPNPLAFTKKTDGITTATKVGSSDGRANNVPGFSMRVQNLWGNVGGGGENSSFPGAESFPITNSPNEKKGQPRLRFPLAAQRLTQPPAENSGESRRTKSVTVRSNETHTTTAGSGTRLWGRSTVSTTTVSTSTGNPEEKGNKTAVVLPRIQKLMDDRQKATTSPCLICASPSCPRHSSASFRKSNITLCHPCEKMFDLSFIADCVSTPDEADRAGHVNRMVDLYDKSVLLLRYSAQYVDGIAAALEHSQEQQNKIGLGSSGVGVVSGVLGVAAAATILTPAGPPLLVASLLFGGGATAVQAGTEAMNYRSEPNGLADRIIALHGMVHSILRITSTLHDAMLRNHRIRTDDDVNNVKSQKQKQSSVARAGLMTGVNVGRSITLGGAASGAGSAAAAEMGVIGARTSTALTRAGTAAARTMRFARFAGGALSAAVLVMEANAIKNTLQQIQDGNPCDKATNLRRIRDGLGDLPSTEVLDKECQTYLRALAANMLAEWSDGTFAVASPYEDAAKEVADKAVGGNSYSQGTLIVDGEDEEAEHTGVRDTHGGRHDLSASTSAAQRQPPNTPRSFASTSGSSLLERIQMHRALEKQKRTQSAGSCAQGGGMCQNDLDLTLVA